MEKTLMEYGVIGIILAYFLWKDRETFNLYKTTMRELVDELKTMHEEQKKIKCDVDNIKEKLNNK